MTPKSDSPKTDTEEFDPLEIFKSLTPAAFTSQAWMEALTSFNAEITSFMAERVKSDIETQQALLRCKSLPEVKHVQAEFFQKAFDQYHEETGKLVEMGGQVIAKLKSDAKTDA